MWFAVAERVAIVLVPTVVLWVWIEKLGYEHVARMYAQKYQKSLRYFIANGLFGKEEYKRRATWLLAVHWMNTIKWISVIVIFRVPLEMEELDLTKETLMLLVFWLISIVTTNILCRDLIETFEKSRVAS